jgi:micrococcal nuclease
MEGSDQRRRIVALALLAGMVLAVVAWGVCGRLGVLESLLAPAGGTAVAATPQLPATWTPTPPSPAAARPTATPTPVRTLARVVRVVDGDTIVVEIDGEEYRVRYIGIDTPETVHPDRPVEWMGPEASAANKALVGGKRVYLEKDLSETDQYGRLLRYVFLPEGTFVNAELVRLGYAQVSTYPPDVRYVDLYLEMQRAAQAAGRGLWGPTPTPEGR